jgi:hypothetical protein
VRVAAVAARVDVAACVRGAAGVCGRTAVRPPPGVVVARSAGVGRGAGRADPGDAGRAGDAVLGRRAGETHGPRRRQIDAPRAEERGRDGHHAHAMHDEERSSCGHDVGRRPQNDAPATY